MCFSKLNQSTSISQDDFWRVADECQISYFLFFSWLGGEVSTADFLSQDGSGWTPLMMAVSRKDGEDLVNLFLRKEADVNATSSFPIPKLNPLPSHEAPVNSAPDFSGQTALHFASSKKNVDIARLLLNSKPPASARVKDKRGQYAIHRAAAVGSVPMVELLLKNRSPINAADVAGQTPLHHAIAEGHGDTAIALLKAGAETDKKDSDGFLAIELAPDAQVGSSLSLNHRVNLQLIILIFRRFGSSSCGQQRGKE
jgi:ankyrin repeat protein